MLPQRSLLSGFGLLIQIAFLRDHPKASYPAMIA
jgi:hypothetical protein